MSWAGLKQWALSIVIDTHCQYTENSERYCAVLSGDFEGWRWRYTGEWRPQSVSTSLHSRQAFSAFSVAVWCGVVWCGHSGSNRSVSVSLTQHHLFLVLVLVLGLVLVIRLMVEMFRVITISSEVRYHCWVSVQLKYCERNIIYFGVCVSGVCVSINYILPSTHIHDQPTQWADPWPSSETSYTALPCV